MVGDFFAHEGWVEHAEHCIGPSAALHRAMIHPYLRVPSPRFGADHFLFQADFTTGEEAAAKKASRSFRKYQYRGVELDQLLDMNNEAFIEVGRRASTSS